MICSASQFGDVR